VLDWDPEKGFAGTMSMLGGYLIYRVTFNCIFLWFANWPYFVCSLGKKMAHSKDQAAAAEHVGTGTGKNDEPIGYCFVSLNEMASSAAACIHVLLYCSNLQSGQLAHSAKGESIPLLHPKGKDKPCGTICIRLKAVPRLSEGEIASNLQVCLNHLSIT
jgi:hypothetical protein